MRIYSESCILFQTSTARGYVHMYTADDYGYHVIPKYGPQFNFIRVIFHKHAFRIKIFTSSAKYLFFLVYNTYRDR